MDILTFLTGVNIKDGKRFPLLRDAVKAVTKGKIADFYM